MTNGIAIALGLFVCAMLIGDYALYGSEHLVFLGRKFYALLNWMAFWH